MFFFFFSLFFVQVIGHVDERTRRAASASVSTDSIDVSFYARCFESGSRLVCVWADRGGTIWSVLCERISRGTRERDALERSLHQIGSWKRVLYSEPSNRVGRSRYRVSRDDDRLRPPSRPSEKSSGSRPCPLSGSSITLRPTSGEGTGA